MGGGLRLPIQLLEITVNPPLAESDASLGGEIGGDAGTGGDAVAQRDDARNSPFESLHAVGEGVAQALHDLEQGEVDVAEPAAEELGPAALADHALEIAQEFRHAIAPEVRGAALRGRALLFVIEPARDRMMGVVDVGDEIGDGELQLMRPQRAGFVARRKPKTRAEVEQDIRGLADDEPAGLQERRRIGRMRDAPAVEELHHRRYAALASPARHVDVVGARLLQREADEFAAALDGRPVIELVAHGDAPSVADLTFLPASRQVLCRNVKSKATLES